MNLVFYRTSDVFEAEEILQEHGITTEIVPTPVQDKAYCGVCIQVSPEIQERVGAMLSKFECKMILS